VAAQASVPAADASRALPDGLLDALCVADILEGSVGTVRALMDVRPYADDDRNWWVVSDLTPGLDGAVGRVGADHVLGIVATDVNDRALWVARLNAALNETVLDVRRGSLFEPVRDEQFDLVVINPPFVISPAMGERLVYRDSGVPGDEVVRRIVTSAPAQVAAWGRRTDFLESRDDATLLRERLVVRPDIGQETFGEPGAEDPARIVVRAQRGMRRARQVDTVEAGLVGACDGEFEVAQILDALGSLLARDPAAVREEYLPKVRELTAEGFLEPVALDQV